MRYFGILLAMLAVVVVVGCDTKAGSGTTQLGNSTTMPAVAMPGGGGGGNNPGAGAADTLP